MLKHFPKTWSQTFTTRQIKKFHILELERVYCRKIPYTRIVHCTFWHLGDSVVYEGDSARIG